jgi:hypothetical protein
MLLSVTPIDSDAQLKNMGKSEINDKVLLWLLNRQKQTHSPQLVGTQ